MTLERPEAGPDLVGRTSARLLAAGVARHERLDALHLLAILDASTDTRGNVRRPLDDLAGEFELAPLSVLRSVDHLERVGAVERDGGHVILLGASPEGLGGMRLANFLDDVRASFAGEAPVAQRPGWLARSGGALVAAAAAVAVLLLAPGQATFEQPLALRGTDASVADRAEGAASSDPDAPILRIRRNTTDGVPAAPIPLDTVVAAAQAPADSCVPMSLIADRVDCIVDHDVLPDGLSEELLTDPLQPPLPTRERPPAAPDVIPPTTPAAPSIVAVVDLPASETIETASRTYRL